MIKLENKMRTLSISGKGKVVGVPDVANYQIAIITTADDSKEAVIKNNKKMELLLSIIKEFKIDAKDCQTVGMNIQPEIKWSDENVRQIKGYIVKNSVKVKIRNLEKMSALAGSLIECGLDQFQGPDLEFDDSTVLQDTARELAFKDAKRKATLYCKHANMKLGSITTLCETNEGHEGYGNPRLMMMCEGGAEDVPMAVGEQNIEVNINVDFDLLEIK